MNRRCWVAIVFLLASHGSWCLSNESPVTVNQGASVTTAGVSGTDDTSFRVADSLRVDLVAAEPLIRWPIAALPEADGSLVVLECRWNGTSVEEQTKSRPHQVVRLVDTDGDTRYDRRQVIARDLGFPEGILRFDEKSFLVTTPPVITKLTDNDGDGFYENHDVWFDGGTLTHCANDLHGPMWGPDGWIYWTKGAFAEQTVELLDGTKQPSIAAHLYRRHPQGGAVDRLMTGGMDNPVDLAFLPDGERFFCSTFLHHPGNGVRDGIAHAIYQARFGKPHRVLDSHPKTGPLMNPIVELGPAAPAGLATLQSRLLVAGIPGLAKDDNQQSLLVSAQFNLHKVAVHRLTPSGATFTAESYDLLSTDRADFHPVDVLELPDGSLLVVDTGGWYDLCCPSSGTRGQVAPGGIYRLASITPPAAASPANAPLTAPALDFQTASEDTPSLIAALRDLETTSPRRNQLFWALARKLVLEPENAVIRQFMIEALEDRDQSICRAAANVISLYRLPEAEPKLLARLSAAPAPLRRLLIECLGRLKGNDEAVVDELMNQVQYAESDAAIRHALHYALIERQAGATVRRYLAAKEPSLRWTALWVLNELDLLHRDDTSQLLAIVNDEQGELPELARNILANHKVHVVESLSALRVWWQSDQPQALESFSQLVASWYREPDVAALFGECLSETAPSESRLQALLTVLRSVQGEELSAAWINPLSNWIRTSDAQTGAQLVKALRDVEWSFPRDQKLVDAIKMRCDDPSYSAVDRLEMIRSLPLATADLNASTLKLVAAGLTSTEQNELASACAAILPNVKLDQASAVYLIDELDRVEPIHVESLLVAVLSVRDEGLDQQLFQAFQQVAAAKTVQPERILKLLSERREPVRTQWETFFRELHAPPADIATVIDDWISKLPQGDPISGFHVFRSSKAACAQCHRVGYVGGNIGPELTRIGSSRTKRDLIAAVLFPSLRLEQSYQPTRVLTTDGRVFNGLIANQTETTLELICGADQRCFIAKQEIELQEASTVSIMPAGLDQVLTVQQLADVIAFLENAR